MSTIDSCSGLSPQGRFHFSAWRSPAVIGLSAVALLAAVYYLSIPELISLVVAITLLMALLSRVSHIESFAKTCSTRDLDCSDGGTFSVNETTSVTNQAQPVVSDGGSFERSSAKKINKRQQEG